MQGHLKDFASSDRNEYPFVICERVISKVQELVYDDFSCFSPSNSTSSDSRLPPHVNASLIGIGVVAGAIAQPAFRPVLSDMVVKQARLGTGRRRRRNYSHKFDPEVKQDNHANLGQPINISPTVSPPASDSGDESDDVTASMDQPQATQGKYIAQQPLSLTSLGKLKRHQLAATQTNPSLPLLSMTNHGSRSLDFRVLDERGKSPHKSSPSLPLSRYTSSRVEAEMLDLPAQSLLLRKHYLQTEVKVVLSTVSVSLREC
jgi:hypothetical protein